MAGVSRKLSTKKGASGAIVSLFRSFDFWAVVCLLLDALLTLAILLKVRFTDIDWSTYMEQVDVFLAGEWDYSKIQGATGPIAYPCGHVYVFSALRWLDTSVFAAQAVFACLYLATIAVVVMIYRKAEAPGWLLVLCVLSKRVHSIFVLRMFNDGLAQFVFYCSVLLLLHGKHTRASIVYSLSVTVKMQPLLYCPAFGLCLALAGGWSHLLSHVLLMLVVQLVSAAPFLFVNPAEYLARAFGGPGALQQAWSVNWRFLPGEVFSHPYFAPALLCAQLALLAWFAQNRWTPDGLAHASLWQWTSGPSSALGPRAMVLVLFSCNFVGIACLRTMHFQFLAWYFHTLPFLAWVGLGGGGERVLQGWRWVAQAGMVTAVPAFVEISFLLTTSGWVRGPDGKEWETIGVPTRAGSLLLLLVHLALLALLASSKRVQVGVEHAKAN